MMKLSEAIRLGSMLKPQCFGHLWRDGGSCAIGAAYDALGHVDIYRHLELVTKFDDIGLINCPVCPCTGDRVAMIMHLNDSHHWTREAIADWVEENEQRPTVSGNDDNADMSGHDERTAGVVLAVGD